jgi:uncharacterized RDD family membrane protein YckC
VIGRALSRPALRRLTRGLLAYGIVGLVLSLVAAIAILLAVGRLSSVGATVGGGADQLGTVLARMTTVLDGASTSAASFGTTIDNGSEALTAAASDLRAIVPQLRDIETQANAINILGSQPLAPLAGLFGQIASQLGDLDGRLDTVATNLSANRGALTANAAALSALADETRVLADRLAPDALIRIIDDARWFAIAMVIVVLAGVAVPAAAALAFGWWLRQELMSAGHAPKRPTGAGPTRD